MIMLFYNITCKVNIEGVFPLHCVSLKCLGFCQVLIIKKSMTKYGVSRSNTITLSRESDSGCGTYEFALHTSDIFSKASTHIQSGQLTNIIMIQTVLFRYICARSQVFPVKCTPRRTRQFEMLYYTRPTLFYICTRPLLVTRMTQFRSA